MSGKHRGAAHEEHVDESWLIPYADLLTLLLALFISLYATANADQAKYDAIAQAFQGVIIEGGSMGWGPPPPSGGLDPNDPGAEAINQEQLDLRNIEAQVKEYLRQNDMEQMVNTTIDSRGLVISVNDAALFEPGSASIKPEYRGAVVTIGRILNELNNYIRVEGHTDNVPMSSAMFPSNWELSGSRATSVVRLFTDESHISPSKLSAIGYGEYRPIADNSTPEGRGMNRRVDIIVLSSYYDALEIQHLD